MTSDRSPVWGAREEERDSSGTAVFQSVGSRAERLVCAYLGALPLLWMVGLLLPAALLLTFGIFLICPPARRAARYAWPWFVVGLCQLASVAVNLASAGQPAWLIVRHLLASYVMGWFVLGAAVAVGASGMIRAHVFLRYAARIAFYCFLLSLILYPLAFVYPQRFLHVLTPIGQLLPVSLPSTSFFFGMLLFNWEELFGVSLPRLSFFFPWTTALGFGGLCLALIAANEADLRRRRWTVAGGLFMLIASMSRLVWLALLACAGLRWFLGRARLSRATMVSLALAIVLALTIGSTLSYGSPGGMFAGISDWFGDIRPSASRSRELVYEATWDGFCESPLLGHGWPGEAVYPEDWPQVMQGGGTMVPGSHSTFLGLLYLGGVVTFAAFAFALAWTTRLVATSGGPAPLVRNTLALLFGVALTGVGESLFSVVVPALFAFLWLGIALRACRPQLARRSVGEAALSPLLAGAARPAS
jgi:hypothetical protein